MATVKHLLARPLYPLANLIIFLWRWFAMPRTACRQWFTTGVTIFGRSQLLTPLKNADIEYNQHRMGEKGNISRNKIVVSSWLTVCTNRWRLEQHNWKHQNNECIRQLTSFFCRSHFVSCWQFWYFNSALLFLQLYFVQQVVLQCHFYIHHILAVPHVCASTHCSSCCPFPCGLDGSSFHKRRYESSYRGNGYGLSWFWSASMQLLLSLRCSKVRSRTACQSLDDTTSIVSSTFFQTIPGAHSRTNSFSFCRAHPCAFYTLSNCGDIKLPNNGSTIPESVFVVRDLMKLARRRREWWGKVYFAPLLFGCPPAMTSRRLGNVAVRSGICENDCQCTAHIYDIWLVVLSLLWLSSGFMFV